MYHESEKYLRNARREKFLSIEHYKRTLFLKLLFLLLLLLKQVISDIHRHLSLSHYLAVER